MSEMEPCDHPDGHEMVRVRIAEHPDGGWYQCNRCQQQSDKPNG